MRDVGRPEERLVVADGNAEAELAAVAAAAAEDWRLAAFSSEDEDAWLQERLRRPAKRRKKQRCPDEAAERNATVAVRPAVELKWRFAAVPLTWHATPAINPAAPAELTLTLPLGSSDIGLAIIGSIAANVASSSSGSDGAWQGSLSAPSTEAAEALVSLLRSGHLWCGLGTSAAATSTSGGSGDASAGKLHVSLSDKAVAEATGHPEEQQQVGDEQRVGRRMPVVVHQAMLQCSRGTHLSAAVA